MGCKSTDGKFFQFPKDERIRKQWFDRLGVSNKRLKELHACVLHFDETHWVRHRLPLDILPNPVIHKEGK